ncbi:MAG TPA: hypothetical protein VKA01_04780 [Vicinamibacteria bacterium]|nr:hypothetical protein [Vicinamibacteria bacterium]
MAPGKTLKHPEQLLDMALEKPVQRRLRDTPGAIRQVISTPGSRPEGRAPA